MSPQVGPWPRHGLQAITAERGIGSIVKTLAIEWTMKYMGTVKGLYRETRDIVKGIVKGLSSHLPWSWALRGRHD